LRILITNNHLNEIAGSELVTAELATTLKAEGHQVTVFTFHKGKFAHENIEALGVRVLTAESSDHDDLLKLKPDVIHVHHWPTYLWLQEIGIKSPAVFGFLGVTPTLENPPTLLDGKQPPTWVVSEEVMNNITAIPGWTTQKQSIIRNWIPPKFTKELLKQASEKIEKKNEIVVVSNHFPVEYMDLIKRVSDELNLTLIHIGLPENPKELDLRDFQNAFAVVTIGRTVLLSASLGIPTLMLDHFGSDGWLIPENIQIVRERNFSGRTFSVTPDYDYLRKKFTSLPTDNQLAQVKGTVLDEHLISKAIEKLQSLYRSAMNSDTEPNFGRGVVYTSQLIRRGMTLELQRDNLQTERDNLQTERLQMLNSKSWKVTRPLRLFQDIVKNLKH